MSRHLIIRCDAPGCDAQTETNASDTEPTSVDVPQGWLTLIAPDRAHRHYCSEACLHRLRAEPAQPVVEAPTPEPPKGEKKAAKR